MSPPYALEEILMTLFDKIKNIFSDSSKEVIDSANNTNTDAATNDLTKDAAKKTDSCCGGNCGG